VIIIRDRRYQQLFYIDGGKKKEATSLSPINHDKDYIRYHEISKKGNYNSPIVIHIIFLRKSHTEKN